MLGAFILAVSAPALGSAYTWPAPQLDALEAARFDLPTTLSLGVDPCDSFLTASSGRANVADWVRTAYHDMATYNSEDGTGGLDGSIRFAEEQNRPENAGDGFANTMPFVALQASRYISIADSIALAAITAIESW
ncbi:hypothetical protein R3P38DRAFT_1509227 [Favolaschia claudopus]|uniref:Peroxidase n=1 Tax=Favolaschia claudopus TaxID=2862362 RepID=A0AAW0AJC3_9AGAR